MLILIIIKREVRLFPYNVRSGMEVMVALIRTVSDPRYRGEEETRGPYPIASHAVKRLL